MEWIILLIIASILAWGYKTDGGTMNAYGSEPNHVHGWFVDLMIVGPWLLLVLYAFL